MTPLTDQEIEELRIAIAEEMGWHVEVDDDQFHRATDGNGYRNYDLWCSNDAAVRAFPDYTTSHDAIRQAAMERFKTRDEQDAFQDALDAYFTEVTVAFRWQLTPLDWCIAFARTAKIWRYKV